MNVTLNQHPPGDSSTLMEQLLYYNLTPTRSFLHSETWKDPFCLSICYLKKLLCGHQLDSGLSFFSQRSCMIAFLPLSRYYLDQLEGWEGLRERDTHTHTPSILLKCSSAGVYAGTPRKAKHLQLLPSSSQDLQIFPLLAFLLSTFTSRVHQLQLCRSILAITTSYSHFSLLEPPPPTHSPLKCPSLAATAKMCPQMCFLIICLKK